MTRCVVAALLVLLWHAPCIAQTVCGPQNYDLEDEPNFECPSPGEAEMVPDLNPPASVGVEAGDLLEAMWDGVLMHRHRVLELGLTIRALRRLRWADRLHLAEEYRIELEHAAEVAAARLEFAQEERDAYEERWRQAEQRAERSRAWWRSPALWFTVGVLTAGALVALTAYGLSAVD